MISELLEYFGFKLIKFDAHMAAYGMDISYKVTGWGSFHRVDMDAKSIIRMLNDCGCHVQSISFSCEPQDTTLELSFLSKHILHPEDKGYWL